MHNMIFGNIKKYLKRFANSNFVRLNVLTGYIGHKVYPYLPFLLPHDKNYYGFKHLIEDKKGLFLDVGANDGISAMGFRSINSTYRIISIEPNRRLESRLAKLKKNILDFDFIIAGAGSKTSKKKLYVPSFLGIPIYIAGSFDKKFLHSHLENIPDYNLKGKITYKVQEIGIIKLDDLNLNPDIIKIDTEGYEYEALLGLKNTLVRSRPYILIEFEFSLLASELKFLKKFNYEFYIYDHNNPDFCKFDSENEIRNMRLKNITNSFFCIPEEKVSYILKKIKQ
jgi:FkbM family methyltransferase